MNQGLYEKALHEWIRFEEAYSPIVSQLWEDNESTFSYQEKVGCISESYYHDQQDAPKLPEVLFAVTAQTLNEYFGR